MLASTRVRHLPRVQAISGLLFVWFLIVHLANTLVAAHSAAAYDEMQRTARQVYQYPVVETVLLMAPLTVHIVASLLAIRARWKAGWPRVPWRIRLHRWTGYYLLLVIGGHILATRGSSVFFDVYPEFAGLSYSIWWMPFVFYPYYYLFGVCAAYHALNGAWLALGHFGIRVSVRLRTGPLFWGPLIVVSIALVFALLGLGGVLFDIEAPQDNDYARLYEKHLGVDLGR